MTQKSLNRSKYMKIYIGLAVILVLVAAFNFIQISYLSSSFDKEMSRIKEETRPAKIELVTIKDSACEECFDINPLIETLKKIDLEIVKEENLDLNSDKAREYIAEYNIEKIPTLMLFGELNRTKISDLEQRKDALLFTEPDAPYFDTTKNKVTGLVTAIELQENSCENCVDVQPIIDSLKKSGVKIVSEQVVDSKSVQGKNLLSEYKIETLPALIFSSDLESYDPQITAQLEQIGSRGSDGSYVTAIKSPPYYDLSSAKVVGEVTFIYLDVKGCDGCFDTELTQKSILEKFGVYIGDEQRIDISSSEGKVLVSKYKITKVPTIILMGDTSAYDVLPQVWEQVGTIEEDGAFVFRMPEVFGKPYWDITSGKLRDPATEQ